MYAIFVVDQVNGRIASVISCLCSKSIQSRCWFFISISMRTEQVNCVHCVESASSIFSTSIYFSVDSLRRRISFRLSVSSRWQLGKKNSPAFSVYIFFSSTVVMRRRSRTPRLAYFIFRNSCLIQIKYIHLFWLRFRFSRTAPIITFCERRREWVSGWRDDRRCHRTLLLALSHIFFRFSLALFYQFR